MDDDASSRGAGVIRGRWSGRRRVARLVRAKVSRRKLPARAAARSLGWVLACNFGVAAALVVSTAAGQQLPTASETERLDGQWYRIVRCPADPESVMVQPTDAPQGPSVVYVGRDVINHTGFFAPVRQTHRVWIADPQGELKLPAIRAAVRGSLHAADETAPWVRVFDAPGGTITRPVWWGLAIYGAAFVVPLALAASALAFYAQRAGELLGRWRLARANRCTRCGYSLACLDHDDAPRCPECGTPRHRPQAGLHAGLEQPVVQPC